MKIKTYKNRVAAIVRMHGGYREQEIWNKPHTMTWGETWNEAHKVIEILATEPDESGYFPSFAVDLVTQSICG